MSAPSTYLNRRLLIDKGGLIRRLPEGWPDAVTAGEGLVVTNAGWFAAGAYRVDIDPETRTATIREEES